MYSNGFFYDMEDKLMVRPKIVVTRHGSKISIPTRFFNSKKFNNRFSILISGKFVAYRYDIKAAEKYLTEIYQGSTYRNLLEHTRTWTIELVD